MHKRASRRRSPIANVFPAAWSAPFFVDGDRLGPRVQRPEVEVSMPVTVDGRDLHALVRLSGVEGLATDVREALGHAVAAALAGLAGSRTR